MSKGHGTQHIKKDLEDFRNGNLDREIVNPIEVIRPEPKELIDKLLAFYSEDYNYCYVIEYERLKKMTFDALWLEYKRIIGI